MKVIYKKTLLMNLTYAIFNLMGLVMIAIGNNDVVSKLAMLWFFAILASASILTSIVLYKNDNGKLNKYATQANYIYIPLSIISIFTAGILGIIFCAIPLLINLVALRRIMDKSAPDFASYRLVVFNFLRSIFR